MKPLRLAAVLCCSVACADATSSPRPEAGVSPAAQWSGGTVQVHSAAFSGQALLSLYAAGAPVAVTRFDDTTLSVRLPVVPTGDLVISRHQSGRDTVVVVHVAGLASYREVPGDLGYEPLVPEGPPGVRFVGQDGQAGLTILDPATDQVTTIPGLLPVQLSFGLAPTYQENRYVLQDSTGLLSIWQLFPAAQFIDTAVIRSPGPRHVTQLNDSTWLSLYSNALLTTLPSGSHFSGPGLVSDPLRVVFSPDGSRVALVMASAPGSRAPVLDGATGDTAFTFHAHEPTGAAFSRATGRLYVTAGFSFADDTLLALRGSDGAVLAQAAVPTGYNGYGLAVDPRLDRVYQVAESSGTRALFVYDGATLALLGQATASSVATGLDYSWSAGIGVDTLTHRIHVAFPGSPIPVISYDRLP